MRSSRQENTSRRSKRDLRLASMIGLLLAGLGVGVAEIGDATALDKANQFRTAARKNGPPGKPFAPIQRRLPGNPDAGRKGPSGPAVGNKNEITHTDQFGKGAFGRTGLGKSATRDMPYGRGLSDHLGKGL